MTKRYAAIGNSVYDSQRARVLVTVRSPAQAHEIAETLNENQRTRNDALRSGA